MPAILIDDSTSNDVLFPADKRHGLVLRDYTADPMGMFAPPSGIPLIPRSEWDARIAEQDAAQSSMEHVWRRTNEDCLDQNGQGFCWAYSTAHAIMMKRMLMNQPLLRLSAHAVACKIKNFKDEGAWCGLSAQFARTSGYPTVSAWPEKSMSRVYDTPATWAQAASYKITEDWVDLSRPVWGQNLTFDQLVSCLLMNMPCPTDWEFWSHSVLAVRPVRVEPGSYGVRILNSWTPAWGEQGFATIRETAKIKSMMGALAIRTVTASANLAA